MPLYVHMSSRDPTQGHRGSSPLELFFDLTFVVAVAQAGSAFQRGLVGNEAGTVLTGYPLVFFAIALCDFRQRRCHRDWYRHRH